MFNNLFNQYFEQNLSSRDFHKKAFFQAIVVGFFALFFLGVVIVLSSLFSFYTDDQSIIMGRYAFNIFFIVLVFSLSAPCFYFGLTGIFPLLEKCKEDEKKHVFDTIQPDIRSRNFPAREHSSFWKNLYVFLFFRSPSGYGIHFQTMLRMFSTSKGNREQNNLKDALQSHKADIELRKIGGRSMYAAYLSAAEIIVDYFAGNISRREYFLENFSMMKRGVMFAMLPLTLILLFLLSLIGNNFLVTVTSVLSDVTTLGVCIFCLSLYIFSRKAPHVINQRLSQIK